LVTAGYKASPDLKKGKMDPTSRWEERHTYTGRRRIMEAIVVEYHKVLSQYLLNLLSIVKTGGKNGLIKGSLHFSSFHVSNQQAKPVQKK
jgi:hypothetical protein